MKKNLKIVLPVLCSFLCSLLAWGQEYNSLALPSTYSDHMVLQRDTTVIAGWSKANEEVTISLGKYSTATTSDAKGNWKAILYGTEAGGPYELEVATKEETKIFKDVLIGDVWLASGQSNMQWSPNYGVDGWNDERKQATYENIRLFHVQRNPQIELQTDLVGHAWKKCTPKNLAEFSAVAYYFSKYIHESQHVPIGIINSSFGGTKIEAWMTEKALTQSKVAYAPPISSEEFRKGNQQRQLDLAHREEVFTKINIGERLGTHKSDYDDSDWKEMECPQNWAETELRKEGLVWFRKKTSIEDISVFGDSCKLSFGNIQDIALTYINGTLLENQGDLSHYYYHFPSQFLKNGENAITVRILRKRRPNGGFLGKPAEFYMSTLNESKTKISLAGSWKFNQNIEPNFPRPYRFNPRTTLLYNGMIAPLTAMKIKGFLWYQGESNAPNNYSKMLEAMIADWRANFETHNAPFLVIQLPNFREYQEEPTDDAWARMREQQAKVQDIPNVMTATIIDLGEEKDIHPRNKKDVGYRLSLVARKKVYSESEKLVHSGPTFKYVKFKGNKAIIVFDNVGKGLKSKDGEALREFALAGVDEKFYWGKAKIINKKTIEVTTNKIKNIVAVRYAWQSNPKVNLYNQEGLPAAPFRTDDWEKKN